MRGNSRMLKFFLLLFIAPLTVYGTPVEISSISDLQKIGNDPSFPLDGHYVLNQDIDAAETATWNGGKGFLPIGKNTEVPWDYPGFSGLFDGQGHTISGLAVTQAEDNGIEASYLVGLFGVVTGEIRNLGLSDFMVTGANNVGGLAGENKGTVANCHASGTARGVGVTGLLIGANFGIVTDCHAAGVSTVRDGSLGGLIGVNGNTGEVTRCYAEGTVGREGACTNIGGLIGDNDGTVVGCYSTCSVLGHGFLGGLIGDNNSLVHVKDCYATGSLFGNAFVGGLIGSHNEGTVTNCHASGAVNAMLCAGGLVAVNFGEISDCYATGDVKGTFQNSEVGGLIGLNEGPVSGCHAEGDVAGLSQPVAVGGLVGRNTSTLTGCFASGAVSGTAELNAIEASIGGLVGYNEGQVTICHALGTVTTTGMKLEVGGFVGRSRVSTLTNCYASGAVIVTGTAAPAGLTGHVSVGGFAGFNETTLVGCRAAGAVTGTAPEMDLGGFVGQNSGPAATGCYATGESRGTATSGLLRAGGLTGYNQSALTDCFATGAVTASGPRVYVGGLIGANYSGPVTECYAAGAVKGTGATFLAGGLAGDNMSAVITSSYWDKEATLRTSSSGSDAAFGKTTVEMKQPSTYVGWDFASTWGIDPSVNLGYPYLTAFRKTTITPSIAPMFVEEGQFLELSAPSGTDYQWMKDGQPVVTIGKQDRIKGMTTPVLSFDPVLMSDEGVYTCQYTVYGLVQVTAPLLLQVREPDSVPVAGVTGMALLAGLLISGACVSCRKKK